MENLGFLIFIILIFLFQALGQILKRQQKQIPQEKKPSKQKTLEDILRTMGFPPMEEPPIEEEPVEVVIEEEKKVRSGVEEVIKEKPSEEKELTPVLVERISEKEFLPLDKLEEAIIYSTIIGPPKARQIRRGVGIGIRSGLKNRCP